uniref:C2H2-type domain-containing protein n=1 Tax=Rhabditophanes sp. KR3021 TaxID=114890 RepID=A0AC35UIP0_9BILA
MDHPNLVSSDSNHSTSSSSTTTSIDDFPNPAQQFDCLQSWINFTMAYNSLTVQDYNSISLNTFGIQNQSSPIFPMYDINRTMNVASIPPLQTLFPFLFKSSNENDSTVCNVSQRKIARPMSTDGIKHCPPAVGNSGKRKDYCYVCKKFIISSTGRCQGPRRHILQFHVKNPLYLCKLCNFSSTYDKFHVTSHIKRFHNITKNTDAYMINNKCYQQAEVCIWYRSCFELPGEINHSQQDEKAFIGELSS